jgi:hypothetical protein
VALPLYQNSREEPGSKQTVYPARFDYQAAASRPLVGRVTDADTGEPVGQAMISAGWALTYTRFGKPYIATLTDADGRYRLEGLPEGEETDLYVMPPAGTAYLPTGVALAVSRDKDESHRDVTLKRGVLIQGRLLEERTGKPLTGGVQYVSFADNPHLEAFPGFHELHAIYERRTDDDGRFHLRALIPGRKYALDLLGTVPGLGSMPAYLGQLPDMGVDRPDTTDLGDVRFHMPTADDFRRHR